MNEQKPRKFLVKDDYEFKYIVKHNKGTQFRCGYITIDGSKKVKIIIDDENAYLFTTFDRKPKFEGAMLNKPSTRSKKTGSSELKYKIPIKDANDMFNLIGYPLKYHSIEKNYYNIEIENITWRIDSYYNELSNGLILASALLDKESKIRDLPDWIDKEVTDNPYYLDDNLINTPYLFEIINDLTKVVDLVTK